MKGTPTSFTCPQCGGEGVKELGAINAARKAGRNIYCSHKCSIEGRRTRTPEQRAEYMRKYREANRQKANQYAKDYRNGKRRTPREVVLSMQRENYRKHRDENLRRMKAYRKANYPKIKAGIQRWLDQNPDKKDLYAAKANLATQFGLKVRDIPDDLALALVEQWKIKRWVKEHSAPKAKNEATP